MRELGAAGAIPAGLGVVEGGALPYKPEALAKKKENFANRLKLDPEIKCYLPGVPRAIYMPLSVSDHPEPKHVMIVHEFAGAVRTIYMDEPHRGAGRQLDGLVERALGRRDAGRRHARASTI